MRLLEARSRLGGCSEGNWRLSMSACCPSPLSWPAGPAVSLTPAPPESRPALDAAAAYQRAARRVGASIGRSTVGLAMATTRLVWDDGGPAERLVYVVRWDNVSWMPSGPRRADGRGRGPVIGTRTVLVDAGTGALLLHILNGRSAGQADTL